MPDFEGPEQTRRTFVKVVTYVAPAILTLKAAPARAHEGSHHHYGDDGLIVAPNNLTQTPG